MVGAGVAWRAMRLRWGTAWGVVAAGALLLLLAAGPASADRAFAPRFSQNAQGDIAMAANTLLSCDAATDATCAATRAGTATPVTLNNNNAHAVTYVDVDGDPSTFDSSSATLALPAGARVLFAGLYWGARSRAGIGGVAAPDAAQRATVRLRTPGSAASTAVTASQLDTAGDIYQGFADVTDTVSAAGAGAYTVADVQAGTGRNDAQLAGWSLVVAYGDATQPPRNLSVFDGLQNVASNATTASVALSGFRAPAAGTVRSRVGIVAYEGDLATTGDGATLLGRAGDVGLPQGARSNNLFKSSILVDGAEPGGRVPAYANQLGFDANVFSTSDLLGNGQTATTVRLITGGDAYQPGVVTLATDLFAPRITATKAVDRAEADLGDVLTYTTTVANTGEDGATDVTFDDRLPAGTAFVPGTLTVDGAPQPDPVGADVPAALGTIAPGGQAVVTFRVRIASGGLPVGTVLENVADVGFTAADLGTRDEVQTAPARTAVRVPGLDIAVSHDPGYVAGEPSTITVEVTNAGDGPTQGTVTVTDDLPEDVVPTGAATGVGWTCAGTSDITCTRDDPLPPGEAYPPITIPVQIAPDAVTGVVSNTVRVASAAGDDAATDTAAVASSPDPNARGEAPAAPAPDPAGAAVQSAGSIVPPPAVQTACTSRRTFAIRLRERSGAHTIRAAQASVDGRRVAVLHRRDGRWDATVDLRGLPKQTYNLVLRATLRDGHHLRWVRSYRTCAAKLPPSNHLDRPQAL
jgi:uncharacterized repeat protein (TIGR01451 family)